MLQLGDAADLLFHKLRHDIERRQLPGGDLDAIAEWASRQPARVLRMAALVQLLTDSDSTLIEEAAMAGAIRLGTAAEAHASAVLTTAKTATDARRALDWIAARREFSEADLYRERFRDRRPQLESALQRLVAAGYVRRLPTVPSRPGGGRPPSPVFVVNPHAQRPDPTKQGAET